MKTLLISLFFLQFLCAGVALAHETEVAHEEPEATVEAIVEAEAVTNADLGVQESGVLPTSPLYFFKEIGRGLQRAFTFSAVAKTELELQIASEKAAEAKKVAEENPNDEKGIKRALLNYTQSQERLRARLEGLRETSENPNIDKFLDKVAARVIAHEKLFAELRAKHEAQKALFEDIENGADETMEGVAAKDTAEKFRDRLEFALENTRGSTLKHVRSIEFIDRLRESRQISDDAKDKLDDLRNKLSEKTGENIEKFVEEGEEGAGRLREALQRFPSNVLKRTVILEEIRARASERAAYTLDEVRASLDDSVEDARDFEEAAKKRIAVTEERVGKIEARVAELGDTTPQVVRTLLENAKKHLEGAKTALAKGNPRVAFGLSRAAEVVAVNIVRILEQGVDAVRSAPQLIDRVQDRIPRDPRPADNSVVCTMEYAPVCGVDGKTYSNRCVAELQNKVRVSYAGECKVDKEGRKYESRDVGMCTRILFFCVEGLRPFSDNTGCGCEPLPAQRPALTPTPTPVPSPVSVVPLTRMIAVKADDTMFSPSEIRVAKGTTISLTFNVSETNVYYAGLDFRSSKFTTSRIDPGKSTTVQFVADESFEFKSYWPATGVLKATGRVIVE